MTPHKLAGGAALVEPVLMVDEGPPGVECLAARLAEDVACEEERRHSSGLIAHDRLAFRLFGLVVRSRITYMGSRVLGPRSCPSPIGDRRCRVCHVVRPFRPFKRF